LSGAGFRLEPVTDRWWLAAFIKERWGEPGVVSRGRLRGGEELSAIRVMEQGALSGVASWYEEQGAMELVTIDSLRPGRGVGTALIDAVIGKARDARATRLWLITTNDNVDALRFYQRRGWLLSALHVGAVEGSRRLKPSIPLTGAHGIPIRDEIELEYPL
jgi:ribosomal protein S18 acetylase RimI-like enzyme